ncbi:MAG: hypothetical protein IJW83_01580 [Clostridia bacterium]|nr:hypothetical protein [Clostridia bacterium]
MANIFSNRQAGSPMQINANRYNSARISLLLVVICTALNVGMLAAGGYSYFLFSAAIPYLLTDYAMFFCGMYPADMYEGAYESMTFLPPAVFAAALVLCVFILGLYLLFWYMSKKLRTGWLIAALVFFCLDTILLIIFYGLASEMLLDILFHIYVIVSLFMGISAAEKLKKEAAAQGVGVQDVIDGEAFIPDPTRPDSTPLRFADTDVKARTFLEAEVFGHQLVYRRVKRTNELVIDGRVYAEYTALLERAHMLSANMDGHAIAVGYNGINSYIMVDGQPIAEKLRWV